MPLDGRLPGARPRVQGLYVDATGRLRTDSGQPVLAIVPPRPLLMRELAQAAATRAAHPALLPVTSRGPRPAAAVQAPAPRPQRVRKQRRRYAMLVNEEGHADAGDPDWTLPPPPAKRPRMEETLRTKKA
jgi:hypothetical protein